MVVFFMRHLFVLLIIAGGLIGIGGCTTSTPQAKPLPDITFAHMPPFPVNVAVVNIESGYDPAQDSRDISSGFPAPPDVALKSYAAHRLQPAGPAGRLTFIIENVFIHQTLVKPEGDFVGWLGVGREDLYEAEMKIRMHIETEGQSGGTDSVLAIRRSLSIPQSYSVAEKEQEKFIFIEMMMKDVDTAVTSALKDKMVSSSGYGR